LQHVYNTRRDGSGLLLVMNHGDMNYRRDAVLQNDRQYVSARVVAEGNWEGWRPGGNVELSKGNGPLRWSFVIPPKGFLICEFQPR